MKKQHFKCWSEEAKNFHQAHHPRKLINRVTSPDYNNLNHINTTNWRLPSLLNLNIRSVINKLDALTNLIDVYKVDIASITETWLFDEVPTRVIDICGYTCERSDRVDRKGGGPHIHPE